MLSWSNSWSAVSSTRFLSREVAKSAYVDDGDLSKWERGLARPQTDAVERIDNALKAGGQLAALGATIAELGRLRTLDRNGISDEEKTTERRQLLQLATTGVALGALGTPGEAVRQLLDAAIARDRRSIEEWELACVDHLHALRTRPPARVAADLGIDLLGVRRQLDMAAPTELADLHRIAATLATVHANALTRLGEHGAAIRWWRTARHAADASGDLRLRLLVRAEEAGHGLYGQRDVETVLRLVRSAEQLAGRPGIDLLTTRAKALSLLGRHDEAQDALRTIADLTEKDVPGDPFGFWSPNQIHFAESWVHAASGQEAKAGAARELVLESTRDYQYRANVQLHESLCLVAAGGVQEGMRRAAEVIAPLEVRYRSNHITETARMVLHAVPADQRHRPAVKEFGAVLSAWASR
jgi:tetratricopeptide (TPR) repeat protein